MVTRLRTSCKTLKEQRRDGNEIKNSYTNHGLRKVNKKDYEF